MFMVSLSLTYWVFFASAVLAIAKTLKNKENIMDIMMLLDSLDIA